MVRKIEVFSNGQVILRDENDTILGKQDLLDPLIRELLKEEQIDSETVISTKFMQVKLSEWYPYMDEEPTNFDEESKIDIPAT